MRHASRVVFSGFLLLPLGFCVGQEKSLQPSHAPDGGTMERFASITIPAKAGAPFTATVNTEWIRRLADGSNITLKNHRSIARDGQGRIFEERAFFVPDDGRHESTAYQIEISDPATHQRYVCHVAERVCRLQLFLGSAAPEIAGSAPLDKAGTPGTTVENLGTQAVSGLQTVGTRETHVVQAATIGNEAPILEKKEFWYSPELGINLITKRQEARFSSEQNFEVTNISLSDPEAKLFAPPAGYTIVDLRKPQVSAAPTSAPD